MINNIVNRNRKPCTNKALTPHFLANKLKAVVAEASNAASILKL